MKWVCNTEDTIATCARDIVSRLQPEKDHATVIGLSGDLGAGKTTFVQHVARQMGVEKKVTSPTFVILKAYRLPEGVLFKHLLHIDAYRIEEGKEVCDLGWNNIIDSSTNIVFVEWPERIADILPSHTHTLTFTHVDEGCREITTSSL